MVLGSPVVLTFELVDELVLLIDGLVCQGGSYDPTVLAGVGLGVVVDEESVGLEERDSWNFFT